MIDQVPPSTLELLLPPDSIARREAEFALECEAFKAIATGNYEIAGRLRERLGASDQRIFDNDLLITKNIRAAIETGDIPKAEECAMHIRHQTTSRHIKEVLNTLLRQLMDAWEKPKPSEKKKKSAALQEVPSPTAWDDFIERLHGRVKMPQYCLMMKDQVFTFLKLVAAGKEQKLTESDALTLFVALLMIEKQWLSVSLFDASEITFLKESVLEESVPHLADILGEQGYKALVKDGVLYMISL